MRRSRDFVNGARAALLCALIGAAGPTRAWAATVTQGAVDTATKAPKPDNAPLFRETAVLNATFTANLKTLRKDKADEAPWRQATLSYADPEAPNGLRVSPVRARTRGMWRLKNCEFPPIRLNFANKEVKGTVWHDLDEPKLVNFCRNNDTYEQYILQEYQLYRLYQLLTPVSYKARLLRLSYADSTTGKVETTRYAFIVQDPSHLAKAAGGKIFKATGARPDDIEPRAATVAYLFQYLIGNTDFSFYGLHNAELLAMPSGQNLPLVYDFDFSGVINASYATPDVSLPIKRVRTRLYRGFCQQNAVIPEVLDLFRQKKDAIYALYADEIGALMTPKNVQQTLEYFDEFYAIINSPKELQRRIISDCRSVQ